MSENTPACERRRPWSDSRATRAQRAAEASACRREPGTREMSRRFRKCLKDVSQLGREQLCQRLENGGEALFGKRTDSSRKPSPINRANLIDSCDTRLAPEPRLRTKGISTTSGERHHNNGRQRSIQFVRGDHDRGSSLLHLSPNRWIEADEKHLPSLRHHQTSSKSFGKSPKRGVSSPRAWHSSAAFAQPSRRVDRGRSVMLPFRTMSSTSSAKPASSIAVFGRRTPLEFPIRMSRAFIEGITS